MLARVLGVVRSGTALLIIGVATFASGGGDFPFRWG